MSDEKILRSLIREELQQEGFMDWMRGVMSGKGGDIRKLQKFQEALEEVYTEMGNFQQEHPRKVARIRRSLSMALTTMDGLVSLMNNTKKRVGRE